MSRKKVVIDLEKVAELAGRGLTQGEIAACLGISSKTLYRNKAQMSELSEAIEKGKANAAREVSNRLFELCKRGNLGAIVWYEKTRRGLSDKLSVEVDWREQAKRDGFDENKVSEMFEDMVGQFMQSAKGVSSDGSGSDADV